ncbi:heme biosynthesis HemY N-terminal domain-containing protein [Lacibacterium aquatile]|uniref:Heme biosynthesis HemY N-terminal domain-containing protein n=1 Tax=Lacibacterium aquatile TaxID=1168082 RepID=A0ABW5DRC5_9PROT
MRRLVLYCVKVSLLVALAVYLANEPGTVRIDWHGWRIETNVALLIVLILLLTLLAYGAALLWRLVRAGPRGWHRRRQAAKRDAGFAALTQGLIAVAAGDAEGARSAARKSFGALGDRPLALLLTAQAAMLDDDEVAARRSFEAMLERPETAFLGHRGLAAADLKSGDLIAALEHVERAIRLKPKSRWALSTAVDLAARIGQWQALGDYVDAASAAKVLSPEDATRYRLLVALGAAEGAMAGGDAATAEVAADTALKHAPDAIPAVLIKARALLASGKPAKARSFIEKHWNAAAHPDLGALYIETLSEDNPLTAASRADALLKTAPERAESHLVIAELSRRAHLWGEARRHLLAAESDPATRHRVYSALAELEMAEHNDLAKADAWRVKAMAEQPQPAWHCVSCGSGASSWSTRCTACGTPGGLTAQSRGLIAGGPLLPATAL